MVDSGKVKQSPHRGAGGSKPMRKAVALAVVAMMVVSSLFAMVTPDSALYVSDEGTSDGLTYSYDEGKKTATVTGYGGDTNVLIGTHIQVPNEVSKDDTIYDVTSIGPHAFENCMRLEGVSIPSGIEIGEYAFGNCMNLTSVSIEDITTIPAYAFYGCAKLEVGENFLKNITSVGAHAFDGCKKAVFKIHDKIPKSEITHSATRGHRISCIRRVWISESASFPVAVWFRLR